VVVDDVDDDAVSKDETFLINFLGSLVVVIVSSISVLLVGSIISTISPSFADIHSYNINVIINYIDNKYIYLENYLKNHH